MRRQVGRRWTDKAGVAAIVAVLALALVSTYQGCSNNDGDGGGFTVSGPSAATPAPVAAATPAPQTVDPTPDPNANQVPVTYSNNGNVHIENLSSILQVKGECLFQVYDGGEQQIRRDEPDSIKLSPGGTADFSLDVAVGCYQNDVIPGGDNCQNFNHADAAYFKDGKRVAHHSGLTGCNPKPPRQTTDVCPNLEGQQTEVPEGYHLEDGICVKDCEVEWIAGEPVRENETEYGSCQPGAPEIEDLRGINYTNTPPPTADCPGHKSRTVDIVVYETNSCTQETREKSRIEFEEQAPCTAQCEQAFCHTENFRIDKGWRWQCQNVPPGTPGHWPGHFQFPHGDFFGACNSDKCYKITN